MALDPSIPLRIQQTQIRSPLELRSQVEQFKALQSGNQMQQLQAREARMNFDKQMRLKDLAAQSIVTDEDGTQKFDQDGFMRGFRMIDPLKAQEYSLAMKKAELENLKNTTGIQKDQTDMAAKKADWINDNLAGVRSQADYDAARQRYIQTFGEDKTIPLQFDPTFVQYIRLWHPPQRAHSLMIRKCNRCCLQS